MVNFPHPLYGPAASNRSKSSAHCQTTSALPVVQINGDNPAIIHIGDTYADLGATITGPTPDLSLGVNTFLNGRLASNIVLDTSSVATDTIDYFATDTAGLTSTSTRQVIIEATATTAATEATSTAQ